MPAWAKDVVWYQIFVERFRNGDPSNDPTLHDMESSWPPTKPEGWQPTPWTHDWYRQEDWAGATGEDFYYTAQLRRYGGDLQGVLDRLDYLRDLGVTALYFNPINDAPSLHKYDARTYRHIDRNFGPDPQGDEALIAAEDPTDPATWQWTAADSLFVDGTLTYRLTDDARGLLAYECALVDARALVAFNTSDQPQTMTLDAENGSYRAAFPAGETIDATDGVLTFSLPPRTARVWLRQ